MLDVGWFRQHLELMKAGWLASFDLQASCVNTNQYKVSDYRYACVPARASGHPATAALIININVLLIVRNTVDQSNHENVRGMEYSSVLLL